MVREKVVRQLLVLSIMVTMSFLSKGDTKPNIVLLIGREHSTQAVGAYKGWLKSKVSTPNLDRVAAEGAYLKRYFTTNASPGPAWATMLTGHYSHKNGTYDNKDSLDTKDIDTYPSIIQKSGYETAVVGKWQLCGDGFHGFDYYALSRSVGDYSTKQFQTPEGIALRKGYSSDVYGDLALDWLKQRKKDKPFMLTVKFQGAKHPWQFPERHADFLKDDIIPEPESLKWDFLSDTN